jgi:hypothetical protein
VQRQRGRLRNTSHTLDFLIRLRIFPLRISSSLRAVCIAKDPESDLPLLSRRVSKLAPRSVTLLMLSLMIPTVESISACSAAVCGIHSIHDISSREKVLTKDGNRIEVKRKKQQRSGVYYGERFEPITDPLISLSSNPTRRSGSATSWSRTSSGDVRIIRLVITGVRVRVVARPGYM